jgi:hypothetical protein
VIDRGVTEFIQVKVIVFREIKERESRDLISSMLRYVVRIIIAQFKASPTPNSIPVIQVLEKPAGMYLWT